MKNWIILNEEKIKKPQDVIRVLFKNRKITSKKEKEEFLNPNIDRLSAKNAGLNKNELDKAKRRIKNALQNEESVVVYTDYDADGVCAGTIIWETLYGLGAKVMPYVPHRVQEGYGLSQKGIDHVRKEYNAKLIITVDHGVTAGEQVAYAKKIGIDVIIIDHHALPAKLPDSVALIHTTGLCATAVAWFFAGYLEPFRRKSQYLDLVALATIADLIPLTGVNRNLVKFGLIELNETKRLGLLALIKACGLTIGSIGTYEVGHMLTPRINAAGRLTHAIDALRLLCTKDKERAKLIAENLSLTNRERQVIMEETIIHAKNLSADCLKNNLIFIADEKYNQGVIGLVAGKLTEEYYLPSVVISVGEKYSKASARSIAGFNIVEALRTNSDLLVDIGGHPMACGFTVETAKITLLEKNLINLVKKELTQDKLQRFLKIDCELNLESIDFDFYKSLKQFAPFGVGNFEPVFASRKVKIVRVSLIGKNKNHLKISLQPNTKYNNYINAIGFGMGQLYKKINFDSSVDIAYVIDENVWNGETSLQLKLKDVKFPQ